MVDVNVGSEPNSGDGDPLRTAFIKLNANVNAEASAREALADSLADPLAKLAGIEAGAQVNTVGAVAGKTGNVTLVRADVGLSNVDNTTDAEKAYRASLWQFFGDTAATEPPLLLDETGRVLAFGGAPGQAENLYRLSLWQFFGDTDAEFPALVLDETGFVIASVSPYGATPAPATIRLRPATGQSNAEGQAGTSVEAIYPETLSDLLTLTRGANADVWLGQPTTGGTSIELIGSELTGIGPLVPQIASTGTHGTTSAEASARVALRANGSPILVWSGAEGGQTIANLLPGAPAGYYGWDNMVTAMTRAAALASSQTRLVMDWLSMAQGESDTGNSALGSQHNDLRADLQAQAESLFDQTDATRMISWQMSSFAGNSAGVRSILRWALDHADDGLFFCGGPTYGHPWSSDYLHNTSRGHAMRGEAEAAIIRRVEAEGVYLPLHIVSASVTGANTITAILSEPAVIDTTDAIVATIADAGVVLTGGTVSAITVSGSVLTITTAGAAASVTEIRLGTSGQTTPRTETAIPRTNIRAARHLGQYSWGGAIKSWHCHQLVTL